MPQLRGKILIIVHIKYMPGLLVAGIRPIPPNLECVHQQQTVKIHLNLEKT